MKPWIKTNLGAMILSITLVGCGGGQDPEVSGTAAKTALGITSVQTAPAAIQFEVVSLGKVAEKRISRSVYDYTYQVSIRNNGISEAAHVLAELLAVPAGTTIIDGAVLAGSIGAGGTVTPSDLIVLRIDRTQPFDPAGLSWKITSSNIQQLASVKPAEVVVLSLSEIGAPENVDTVIAAGAVTDVLLKDGTLRFSTPGDSGEPQQALFTLSGPNGTAVLSQPIVTERPREPLLHVEPSDDGSIPENPPKLLVGGLGPNNSIVGNTLTFKLEGAHSSDLQDDSEGLVIGPNNAAISLKNYWTYDPASTTFAIAGTKLQQLMATLPTGALTVYMNFVSKDAEFASNYAFLAIREGARVAGKLVAPGGTPVTTLAGKKILLRGYNNRLRLVASIDGNGQFSFDNVIPDTYQLTLNDLENPNVVSASAIILAGTTTANVSITYALSKTGMKNTAAADPTSSFVASTLTQDGKGPPTREVSSERAKVGIKAATAASSAQNFTATAAAQNTTITTPIFYEVPKGTQNVGIKITVSTEEYPIYTTQQSEFNDTWSYSVTGLQGKVLSASGSVNQSHFTQGAITRTDCIDVSGQTKDGPIKLGGALSATNIGDSALATVTTVELTTACLGLKITAAKFLSPNQASHPVLHPIKLQGNLSGPYLSTRLSGTNATYSVPLEIEFSPADAKITEVNISVSANGTNPQFSSENLLGQVHVISKGKIRFAGVSLPTFAGARTTGKVVVTVRIKGSSNETEAISDPQEGGQVSFESDTAFTPLYLANDETGLGGRRYGARDAGGDSWATLQTISWLQSRAYRFDDISAMHVAQTSSGRSVLGHSGHSDGQQIDLRYADGQGGYTDALGGQGEGAAIHQMFNAARQEVASNTANKPQLARLQAWIAANRALLDAEASAASTRVIYIGTSFIKLALVDGKFSTTPNQPIPNVPAWSKPTRVQIDPAHLSHWHLSMTAHP